MNICLAAAALALTVVTNTAPDGVNVTYTQVDTDGLVVGEAMTTVHVMREYKPKTYVYRLELTDETPYIIGMDGVKRRVCIVDPDEYAMMTGRIDQVWHSLNATNDGRVKLHGSRAEQIIDETNGVKVTVYKDGYRHTEKLAVRKQAALDKFAGRAPKKPMQIPLRAVRNRRISEKHQKFRDEIEARKNAKPKVITIEHDAATGKDEVK